MHNYKSEILKQLNARRVEYNNMLESFKLSVDRFNSEYTTYETNLVSQLQQMLIVKTQMNDLENQLLILNTIL